MRRLVLAAVLAAPGLAAAQQPMREQPPAAGPLRRFEMPKPQTFALRNGVQVVLVERKTLPMVSVTMLINAGANFEPTDKAGVAYLTGDLLTEGTRTLTGAQVVERSEALGANLFSTAGYTHASAGFTSLSSVFPEMMDLAASIVMEPSFAEFDRVKQQTMAGMQQKYASTEGMAADVINRALFEGSSPYARPVEGVQATVSQLTKADVQQYYARMYGPQNTTVLIVGDVDAATARRVLDRSLGTWKSSAQKVDPMSARNVARRVTGPRVILVDRPGSVQSSIRVGVTTAEASDPDYLTLQAVNRILGGGGDARMGTNLREKHSYTYGAGTTINMRRGPGTWLLSSQVRTNATDSALVEAMNEYRRIVNEPVPTEELAGGIGSMVGSFPNSVQTVQGLSQRLQSLLSTGMPIDFYSTYRERLAALTPADLGRAAKKHLPLEQMTIVVVGDLSKIEQPIRARSFGTVEVWDVEGNKVR